MIMYEGNATKQTPVLPAGAEPTKRKRRPNQNVMIELPWAVGINKAAKDLGLPVAIVRQIIEQKAKDILALEIHGAEGITAVVVAEMQRRAGVFKPSSPQSGANS